MANRILLIDGMALLFRHFYATSVHKQFMRDSAGTPTNARICKTRIYSC